MAEVTLSRLREANVARCEDAYHGLGEWSLTDWATAAAGEMGEACNVVKKLRRLGPNPPGAVHFECVGEVEALRQELAGEIADTVIYLDLLAARAGIDLGEAVRVKFNATSEKVRSGVWL